MRTSATPAIYYVVFMETNYSSFEEAMLTASNVLAAHRERSNEWHEKGLLLMAGAFHASANEPLQTMGICSSQEAAEEYAKGDPFVLHGMVKSWSIRAWANMFA